MSESAAFTPGPAAVVEDNYEGLLASVRAHFAAQTAQKDKKGEKGEGVPLFVTQSPDLYRLFLDSVPAALRQINSCSACRRFFAHYGGLVRLKANGKAVSVMWNPETAPQPYTDAVRALARAVEQAAVAGVFLTQQQTWGQAIKGSWEHLSVEPAASLLFKPTAIKSASQVAAEKKEEHGMLLRGLADFPQELVKKAHSLLTTEALYRSEKCIGNARWLLDVHEQRKATRNTQEQDNVVWLAVARAPAGFCHVRSSMIGTLLEDLAADMPFAEIKTRFDTKMQPQNYQRPQAQPSAGNIAQAEKIIEKLRAAGALERRFARLADIQTLWLPQAPLQAEKKGVFSHLVPAAKASSGSVEVPQITMTWDKFRRTVLPSAETIEYFVPSSKQSYLALVTAKDADAAPILQWDLPEQRNPVSWYFYIGGSAPERWNLKPGGFHPVSAVALQPSMWNADKSFSHHGEKVIFVLKDSRDKDYVSGAGFFPEFLRSEFHGIRATLEAYAKSAVIADKDAAEACGIGLQKGIPGNHIFRVTQSGGIQATYKLDRWD